MCTQVLAASPFSDESHTGEAIARKTSESLKRGGVGENNVSAAVSDNAANMLLGFANYNSVGCAVHSMQLCVNSFLEATGIEEMRVRQKGIVAHFHKSTGLDGLNGLFGCMRATGLPVHHPVRACMTRWSSDYKQMNWFRYEQLAVQKYDTVHSTKAGWAYKEHQLSLDDWQVNEQCCAILAPLADWTQHLQGTKSYPTLPLVLPTVFALIAHTDPDSPLTCSFPEKETYVLYHDARPSMTEAVVAARQTLHKEIKRRFILDLSPEVKRLYYIAMLLHPCFKDVDFGAEYSFVPDSDRQWALAEIKNEWRFQWKPSAPVDGTSEEEEPVGADRRQLVPISQITATNTVRLSGLLSGLVGRRADSSGGAPTMPDELEEYLKCPREEDTDLKLLEWWAGRAARWPNLAKMVKQFLAIPASSAGVERVFSAAGKMHDDLRKSVKDDTLEASLLAAFNHGEHA